MYNDTIYRQYIDDCLEQLIGNKIINFICYVRLIDRSHLVKDVTNWKYFKNYKHKEDIDKIKDFIVRCIAYTIDIDNLNLFHFALESISIIFLSKFENDEFKVRYEWFLRKFQTFDHLLNETIDKALIDTGQNIKEDFNNFNENNNDKEHKEELPDRTVTKYINFIRAGALDKISEKEPNSLTLKNNQSKGAGLYLNYRLLSSKNSASTKL